MAIDIDALKANLKMQLHWFNLALLYLESAGETDRAKQLRHDMTKVQMDMDKILNPLITSTETPASRLRNQLTPMYGLPDMVLAFTDKPDLKEIMLDTARRAKDSQSEIRDTLKMIDELCSNPIKR